MCEPEVLYSGKLSGFLYEIRRGSVTYRPVEVWLDGECLTAITRVHLEQASPVAQWDVPTWWARRLTDEGTQPWHAVEIRAAVLRVWHDIRRTHDER